MSADAFMDEECALDTLCEAEQGSELVQEQQQCEPPQGEKKRLMEILRIARRIRAVTYMNNS